MRLIRWVIAGAVLLVLAAIGLGAWYVFGSSSPAKPTLAPTATTIAGGPATVDGTWHVQTGTNVFAGYRMTEVFAGDVVHKTAVGRTPAVSGTLVIAGSRVTAVDVVADLQQLSSDRSQRDEYIHSHGLESDTFHDAEFKLTTPITLPAPARKGVVEKLTAVGKLTLHGVTRTVTVPLQARWDGPSIDVDASGIPIVLADYHIVPPDTGVVKVDDHGSFELALHFVAAG